MRPSGKTNLIAVVLIAGIIYGIWWVVTYSGVYLDNLNVIDAVKGAFNDSGRVNDANVLAEIITNPAVTSAGTHDEDDGYGGVKTDVVGLGLRAENVEITRDDVRKTIRIEVNYTRKIALRPFKKIEIEKFHYVKEGTVPVMGK